MQLTPFLLDYLLTPASEYAANPHGLYAAIIKAKLEDAEGDEDDYYVIHDENTGDHVMMFQVGNTQKETNHALVWWCNFNPADFEQLLRATSEQSASVRWAGELNDALFYLPWTTK